MESAGGHVIYKISVNFCGGINSMFAQCDHSRSCRNTIASFLA